MNVLVTGANGQLAREFKYLANNYSKFNFVFLNKQELDISSKNQVLNCINRYNFKVIINCAAYTAVDLAEDKKEEALLINTHAVKNLVEIAEEFNLKLIHFSTDYVFNGESGVPYKITDDTNPINYYGVTKQKGEEHIINSNSESIIIRTSWVYSSLGNNFVKTIYRLAREKKTLNVVNDQLGAPTYARDLANTVLKLLTKTKVLKGKSKIYHYTNEGTCTWYDFARAIVEIKKINCLIKPVRTIAYNTKAKRPAYSVLDIARIKEDFDIKIPQWKDSLIKCLNEL